MRQEYSADDNLSVQTTVKRTSMVGNRHFGLENGQRAHEYRPGIPTRCLVQTSSSSCLSLDPMSTTTTLLAFFMPRDLSGRDSQGGQSWEKMEKAQRTAGQSGAPLTGARTKSHLRRDKMEPGVRSRSSGGHALTSGGTHSGCSSICSP